MSTWILIVLALIVLGAIMLGIRGSYQLGTLWGSSHLEIDIVGGG